MLSECLVRIRIKPLVNKGKNSQFSLCFSCVLLLKKKYKPCFKFKRQLLYLCLVVLCEGEGEGSVGRAEVQDKAGNLEKYPDLLKI